MVKLHSWSFEECKIAFFAITPGSTPTLISSTYLGPIFVF